MKFMQIIEYKTSQFDEVGKLIDEWLAQTEGKRAQAQGITSRDRGQSETYIDVIVFPSYEEAMRNNGLPETHAFAQKLVGLCEGDPIFRNLDVLREDS